MAAEEERDDRDSEVGMDRIKKWFKVKYPALLIIGILSGVLYIGIVVADNQMDYGQIGICIFCIMIAFIILFIDEATEENRDDRDIEIVK